MRIVGSRRLVICTKVNAVFLTCAEPPHNCHSETNRHRQYINRPPHLSANYATKDADFPSHNDKLIGLMKAVGGGGKTRGRDLKGAEVGRGCGNRGARTPACATTRGTR